MVLGWNHRLLKILVIGLVIIDILGMKKTISFIIIITNNVDTSFIIIIISIIVRVIVIIRMNFFDEDLINTAIVVVREITVVIAIGVGRGGVIIARGVVGLIVAIAIVIGVAIMIDVTVLDGGVARRTIVSAIVIVIVVGMGRENTEVTSI